MRTKRSVAAVSPAAGRLCWKRLAFSWAGLLLIPIFQGQAESQWNGIITYTETQSWEVSWNCSGREGSYDWPITYIVTMNVDFPGATGGTDENPGAEITYDSKRTVKCKWTHPKAICCGKIPFNSRQTGDCRPDTIWTAQPGDHGETSSIYHITGSAGDGEVELSVDPEAGTYTLEGSGSVFRNRHVIVNDWAVDACSGIRTPSPKNRDDENATYPEKWKFYVKKKYDGNVLKGDQQLDKFTEQGTPSASCCLGEPVKEKYLFERSVRWNVKRSVTDCRERAKQDLDFRIDECVKKGGPGQVNTCNVDALTSCWQLYPPASRSQCVKPNCPGVHGIPELCIRKALEEWQQKIEECP